jgi:hypothetical protein
LKGGIDLVATRLLLAVPPVLGVEKTGLHGHVVQVFRGTVPCTP